MQTGEGQRISLGTELCSDAQSENGDMLQQMTRHCVSPGGIRSRVAIELPRYWNDGEWVRRPALRGAGSGGLGAGKLRNCLLPGVSLALVMSRTAISLLEAFQTEDS